MSEFAGNRKETNNRQTPSVSVLAMTGMYKLNGLENFSNEPFPFCYSDGSSLLLQITLSSWKVNSKYFFIVLKKKEKGEFFSFA